MVLTTHRAEEAIYNMTSQWLLSRNCPVSEELTITPDIGNIDDKPLSDERTVQDINSTVVLLISSLATGSSRQQDWSSRPKGIIP